MEIMIARTVAENMGRTDPGGLRRGPRLSVEVVAMVKRLLALGVDTGTVAAAAGITMRMARYYRAQVLNAGRIGDDGMTGGERG